MPNRELLYFKSAEEWRDWLHKNHNISTGIDLVFYRIEDEEPSMRWEEAVKVAICYGWIDSTVRKLDDRRRKQYYCKRNPKSAWSAINKNYIEDLHRAGLIHQSGYDSIAIAKQNGSWEALDAVENGVIPDDLQKAFDRNPAAFENYERFAKGYRKSYLYWLNQAKREETRQKRIVTIIDLCAQNIKQRS